MDKAIIQAGPGTQIVSSRIFDAKIETLFRAWSEPDHLKNWWGPKGFTNTFHEFEFRAGGKWRFTMHGPEKGNHENECVFILIEPPRRIVWNRISKPLFQVLVTFEESGSDKTRLVFKMFFDSVSVCEKVKKFAVEKNEENFDKLEMELIKMN